MQTNNEFQDRVVLITGAGRGFGRAIALAFAPLGTCLALNDITPINLDETTATVQALGGRCRDYIVDVSKKMPVQSLIQQVQDDWGRLDILVNCASVRPHASLLEMDEWDWHRTLDVNLGGPFFTMQIAGRLMREQNDGVMINLATAAGRSLLMPGYPAYTASKEALVALTRQAALELAPYHVRVNAVCPPHAASLAADNQPGLKYGMPAGLPTETAPLVVYLSSRAAENINGQVFYPDQPSSADLANR